MSTVTILVQLCRSSTSLQGMLMMTTAMPHLVFVDNRRVKEDHVEGWILTHSGIQMSISVCSVWLGNVLKLTAQSPQSSSYRELRWFGDVSSGMDLVLQLCCLTAKKIHSEQFHITYAVAVLWYSSLLVSVRSSVLPHCKVCPGQYTCCIISYQNNDPHPKEHLWDKLEHWN